MSEAIEAHHIIDPDGDTLIILENPDQDFAVWNDAEESLVAQMENKVTEHEVETERTKEREGPDDWGPLLKSQRKERKAKKGKKENEGKGKKENKYPSTRWPSRR